MSRSYRSKGGYFNTKNGHGGRPAKQLSRAKHTGVSLGSGKKPPPSIDSANQKALRRRKNQM